MSFVPMDSLERIKYNIPDILPDHEAYGYSWNVWTGEDIDKPEPDMRYVGYKGEPWDGTYTHSSELELFINDLRSSKRDIKHYWFSAECVFKCFCTIYNKLKSAKSARTQAS